jgi:hypothetical protein
MGGTYDPLEGNEKCAQEFFLLTHRGTEHYEYHRENNIN